MTTYTDEISIYNTDAIQEGIDDAANTASDYLTDVTGGGVMVHPAGDDTSGWRIAAALELLKNGVTYIKAWLDGTNPTVRLGPTSANVEVSDEGMAVNLGSSKLVNIARRAFGFGIGAAIDFDRRESEDEYGYSAVIGGGGTRENSPTIDADVRASDGYGYSFANVRMSASTVGGSSIDVTADAVNVEADVGLTGDAFISGDVKDMGGNKLYADASHSHSASDIDSGTLPVARGGTGATTAAAARANLGISDSGWNTLTLASGWVAYETAQAPKYRKIGSLVELCGAVKPTAATTLGDNAVAFGTLPEGYRPNSNRHQLCQASGTRSWLLTVYPNGNAGAARLRAQNSTSYQSAGTTEWLTFHIMYFVD